MVKANVQEICRDYSLLAPFFAVKLKKALEQCHIQGLEIELFEGYRSPERQDYLFASSRSRPGPWLTDAVAWSSFHQFSVAADLAFKWNGKWQWNKDDPWDKVHAIFHEHGFETLTKEKAHVQITSGINISKCSRIAAQQGLLALWTIIESGLQN